jgi:hypothetical protein
MRRLHIDHHMLNGCLPFPHFSLALVSQVEIEITHCIYTNLISMRQNLEPTLQLEFQFQLLSALQSHRLFTLKEVQQWTEKAMSVPRARKPEHIIYDSCCIAKQQAANNPWFDNIGMCVDPWHYTNKHKNTDTYFRPYSPLSGPADMFTLNHHQKFALIPPYPALQICLH